MQDRRRFPRAKCFKGATIKSSGQTISCVVRNVSAEGAGLQFAYSGALPAEFDLCFNTGRQMRKCRVIWCTPREAGISFEQQA
jgi:hypothetical protein